MRERKLKLKPERKPKRKIRERLMVMLTIGILLVSVFLVLLSSKSARAEDYNFGSENAVKGTIQNPTYKNTEDGSYASLVEGDQYPDTNYSGSTETMTYGTTAGGAFPSALDTDDATRRNYIEANIATAPFTKFLDPTSDYRKQWSGTIPTSPTTHWDKLDDAGTADTGDTTTTYISASATGQSDVFGMSDMTDPGAGATITVTLYMVNAKASGSACNILSGLRIGTTEYQGITVAPTTTWTNTSSSVWSTNPAGGAWTYTAVNALQGYLNTSDASPTPYCTKLVLKISVTYPANYQMQGTIVYNNVLSTSQTTGYQVLCQGYRSASENFYVQVWNYTSGAWVTKATINSASDTDFNFNLLGWTANCERSSGNVVQLRLIDVTGSDTVQDTLFLDLLKIQRIEKGYALEIEMTAGSTNQYGEQRLRIKAYTSAETFYADIYNWTASSWDAHVITISALSNTWYTYELCEATQRSGTQQIKIRFVDATAASSDTTQDTLFLDVAWISWIHTDPTLSENGGDSVVNVGAAATFWLKYTDVDNQTPTYVRINLGGVDYDMTANNSGDLQYWDSKTYQYQTSVLARGVYNYFFKAKDANSGEITTGTKQITINGIPVLSHDCVAPTLGSNGDPFSFHVVYTDLDNNAPSYLRVTTDSNTYDMTANNSGDLNYMDGKDFHYEKAMSGGSHTFHFSTKDYNSAVVTTTTLNLNVNNAPTLSGFSRLPADPVYPTTQLQFDVTFTDLDGDLPTSIKWRESQGAIQNVTMTQTDPGDMNTVDGKVFRALVYLSHGSHEYDFYAADNLRGVSGGSGSVTIENRVPNITNGPGSNVDEYRNIAWYYSFAATDLDGDSISWAKTGAAWLSISGTGNLSGTTTNSPGSYVFTIYANDSFGGSASYSFTLHISNRIPSIINGPGSHVDEYRNIPWYFTFSATDPDGDSLSWARSGASWLSISGTGNLSGTTTNTPGSYVFTVYANDSYAGSDSYAFTLHISNRLPVITSSGNTTEKEHDYLAYHILAADPDLGDSLSYGFSSNATWATRSESWINGTASGVGWYEFTVWANDSYSGSDFEHWHLTVTVDNQAPYFVSTPVYNVANNSLYYYDANAVDPNSDPISYGLTTLCPNLVIDQATGVVSGTPDLAGDYSVNVTATDGLTPPAFQFYVLHVTSDPPSLTSSPIETWEHGTSYSYSVSASDPEGETLLFALEGNGTLFLSINHSSGLIVGIVPSMGYWIVHVSVTDYTNLQWQNYSLSALNAKPSFTSSPILTGKEGNQYYYNSNASDLNNDSLTYEIFQGRSWLFIDSATGELEGTPNEAGSFSIKIRAFDGILYGWQNFSLVIQPLSQPPEPPIPPKPPASGGGSEDEGGNTLAVDFVYKHRSPAVTYTAIVLYENEIVSAVWDFGDGTHSTLFPSVDHFYSHQGYYTVNLTVVDANGLYTFTSKVVRIYLNANDRVAVYSHSLEIYLGWGYILSLNVLVFFAIGSLLLGISFLPLRPKRKLILRIVGVVFMLITLLLLFD